MAERELLSLALTMQQAVQAIDKAISTSSSQTEGGGANFQAAGARGGEMGKERRLRLRIGVAEGNVIAGVRMSASESTARPPLNEPFSSAPLFFIAIALSPF